MAIQVGTSFSVETTLPIDVRIVKDTLADRDAIVDGVRFEGLKVYVKETQQAYRLIGGTTNAHWVNEILAHQAEAVGGYTWYIDSDEVKDKEGKSHGKLSDCQTDDFNGTWFYVRTTTSEEGQSTYPSSYTIDGANGHLSLRDYVIWTGLRLVHVSTFEAKASDVVNHGLYDKSGGVDGLMSSTDKAYLTWFINHYNSSNQDHDNQAGFYSNALSDHGLYGHITSGRPPGSGEIKINEADIDFYNGIAIRDGATNLTSQLLINTNEYNPFVYFKTHISGAWRRMLTQDDLFTMREPVEGANELTNWDSELRWYHVTTWGSGTTAPNSKWPQKGEYTILNLPGAPGASTAYARTQLVWNNETLELYSRSIPDFKPNPAQESGWNNSLQDNGTPTAWTKLMNGISIGANQLKDGSITTEKIADGAITEPKMADNSVSNRTIQDEAVTKSKLSLSITDLVDLNIAPLDTTEEGNKKISEKYLPSYVDDVVEYDSRKNFPAVGEKGKIYVDTSTNTPYRWSGSVYVEISKSLIYTLSGTIEDTRAVIKLTDSSSTASSAIIPLFHVPTSSSDPGKPGLVPKPTFDDKEKFLKGDGTWAEIQSKVAEIIPITIPTTGWTKVHEDDALYYNDVEVSKAHSQQIPIVSIFQLDLGIAKTAELSTTADTKDGYVEFWAKNIPEEEINATLVLLYPRSGNTAGEIINEYILPTATETRLGGVKIGTDIDVKGDGTISVDGPGVVNKTMATSEEVKQTLDSIFGL